MPGAKTTKWAGLALTVLPAAALLLSATMKFLQPPEVTQQFVEHLGYAEGTLFGIALLELLCVVVYLVPQTAALGAILLTGYLGGAIASHVRAGDGVADFVVPLLLGIALWGGLFLRDARVRSLLPVRSASQET